MIDYSKCLRKGDMYAQVDQKNFEAYANGDITLDECFDRFCENNKPKLIKEDFINYLKSLGYSRKKRV